jgi:hypothetical protein
MAAWLIEGAGLADLILLFTAVETVGLFLWHRRTGHGFAPGPLARLLLPGVFLILAWRASLSGWNGSGVLVCLAAALTAHLWDLRDRWRG